MWVANWGIYKFIIKQVSMKQFQLEIISYNENNSFTFSSYKKARDYLKEKYNFDGRMKAWR
jgi:hypothetical protein